MTERSRILIVDDEPFNVDYLEQELEHLGYETESAFDGQEALEKVAANPPDLILLDVMMPRIDGFTVCRMLKDDKKTRLIPIVIMTALHASEDRIKGIEAGADDFLSKPVDDRELRARIQTALRLKRTVDDQIDELREVSDHLAKFGKREQDVSVLALGLRDTPGDESVAADTTLFLMQRYLSTYKSRIREAGGEIGEVREDGLLAIFHGANPRKHPTKAVDTALGLVAETETLNKDNRVQPLAISIGINSGPALVGSTRVESEQGSHWLFTASGSVPEQVIGLVAIAKRSDILVGPGTVERLERRYRLQRLGRRRLKGVAKPVETCRVIGPRKHRAQAAGEKGAAADARFESGLPLLDSVTSPVAEDESPGRGMPWPQEYGKLKEHIKENWGVEDDFYLSRVLSGKSGALVYAVDVTCRDFKGQAILKLSNALDPSWSEEEEADRHRRAITGNKDYATKHLPKIVHTSEYAGQMAILSTIAGRGLEYTVPWALCHYDQQLAAVRQISAGILEGWNNDYAFADGMQRPHDLLRSWLAYRLDPKEGHIHAFLLNECEMAAEEPTFVFEGNWYPNPLAFAGEVQPLPERLRLRAVTGNTHGDLHGLNVLVRGRASDDLAYYLIDLALYSSDTFLFYDHAYFELSYLLQTRETVSSARWQSILDVITGSRSGSDSVAASADDLGLMQLLSVLRNEVFDWIDRHEANRLSYLESQYLLARVAAGLNFVNKPLSRKNRCVSLLYAAANLRDYLKLHAIDWPKSGPPLPFAEADD